MSSCNDLLNELKKCLFDKKEVNIEQIFIKPMPSCFDDLESNIYNNIITIKQHNSVFYTFSHLKCPF